MSKTMITFDIGDTYMKIAKKDKDKYTVYTKQMPEDLVKDGIVQLPHMLTEMIKEVRKEFKLPKCECGLVVPDELVVCRKLTLPAMTEKQLGVNLPFEFSDFISGKPNSYVYDYAMQEMIYDESGAPKEMILTGAVMSKESVAKYMEIFRGTGFKLRTLIPQEVAVTNLMKNALREEKISAKKEYCIVNLGHRSTQVYIFKGDNLIVLRKIYMGGADVDKAIAANEIVDEFLARTHKNTNFNNVLDKEYCKEVFGSIAVEVMKVINFYKFNNRESALEDIFFCGGQSHIWALCDNIAEINEFDNQPTERILPKSTEKNTDVSGAIAIGCLLQ